MTGQFAIIPEYLMQPNSGDKRHYVSRAINAYWILYILEFIESIGSEMVKVLSIISMMIEEEYVTFNVQRERLYFDRESEVTTIDGFGRTPGSNYLHPYISWLERFVNGYAYNKNCPPLPDVTNDQGFDVMQTSIHPLSIMIGNWVPRTTDLSCRLS